ncbi:mechanosensitive ion channel protein 10-like [Fagus crenata]
MVLTEWIAFVCILGFLIASLFVHKLQNTVIWGLKPWKWVVLVLVIFSGRLVTEWFINFLVFLIEMNFLLKKKVLYFVYGLKRSVQVFIWLGLVLLAWGLLFVGRVKRSKRASQVLNYITRVLAGCLIGVGIWLVKNLLESIFHQYVFRTLSGPPLMEMVEKVGSTASTGHLSLRNLKEKAEAKKEVVDVDKLKKMKQEKISAWTMKGLINVIRSSGLSTISNSLDNFDDDDGEQKDEEITSEWQAKAAAYGMFNNVAKPGSKYIDEKDFLRFMKKEEVDNVLPLFEGAVETGKIKRKSLKNWLVNVYLERKSLAHSLNDTKTAIEELNRLVSMIVLLVDIIVCLLLMGFLTTQILVFISSQLLLVVFLFGNTAKTVFEAIIFVFVMHPFDVGDRCVVDGVQKIFYPNLVLSTKPISNFYRSPEMSDSIEFLVDVSTSIESIKALKARIKTYYLEIKPLHWRPGHNVVVKEIENVNKMKMALIVTHTINFQNYEDRNSWRSELILELKKIFEELGIKYQLLPQEVHLRYVGSAPPAFQP